MEQKLHQNEARVNNTFNLSHCQNCDLALLSFFIHPFYYLNRHPVFIFSCFFLSCLSLFSLALLLCSFILISLLFPCFLPFFFCCLFFLTCLISFKKYFLVSFPFLFLSFFFAFFLSHYVLASFLPCFLSFSFLSCLLALLFSSIALYCLSFFLSFSLVFIHLFCSQVLELTKEWANKWNETQNILKVLMLLLYTVHKGHRLDFLNSVCVW